MRTRRINAPSRPRSLSRMLSDAQARPDRLAQSRIVLGSANDFDDLVLFWNLRAAGATLCFDDQANTTRLKAFCQLFFDKLRRRDPRRQPTCATLTRHDVFPLLGFSQSTDTTSASLEPSQGLAADHNDDDIPRAMTGPTARRPYCRSTIRLTPP
jgi:hypothetical protein